MKTIKILPCLLFCFAACGELTEIPDVKTPEKEEPSTEEEFKFSGNVTFSATIEDLADGTSQTWKEGDEILINDGTSGMLSKNTNEGQVGKYQVDVADGSTMFMAYYPYSDDVVVDGTSVKASIPVVQNIAGVLAPMVARSSSTVLFFNNLTGRLGFKVDMEGVKKVILESSSAVAGDISIDFSGATPRVSATSTEITLTGDFQKGQTYYFTLAASHIDECKLALYNENSVISNYKAQNLELGTGTTVSLGTIVEDVPTYTITNYWVYGGTGPQYGGGKLYDLFEKEEFFNNEDGRGISSLKDNYYEMHHNGEFINWAGEDGRNWWMVYSGTQNPVNSKDVDLKGFYELIPRHKATYSVDNLGKITFTRSDGMVTTGQIVPAGKYTLSEYGHEVDVKNIAIRFDISGGKEDWDNMYNEYNAIACMPRVVLIELASMDSSFHTPEASCTIDEDFVYVAPQEPDQKFDFDAFQGTWNVRGGNSSPFGIWVLGGTGDDPAFISPIDKSWVWDDTIWKESDNELIITVKEKTESVVKGTTNYWAGKDGAFWNYIWKNTGEDLSKFYGLLPKGEHEFEIDLSTFVITFDNGVKANLLEPGTHTFIHDKTIDIPNGMFGFDFEVGTDDMETPTSSRWNDVDRFVYGPRNYVMIFEKE